MTGVTTATLWVCSGCGAVSHVDGGAMPDWAIHGFCPAAAGGRHALKPVLVVVPYA